MKTLYMETTKVSASQTVSQIQALLGQAGASAIMTEYKGGEVFAVSFQIEVEGNPIPFRLPCRDEAIFEILYKRKKRGTHNERVLDTMKDQAKRVAWRQILRWIEAQIALVQTRMVRIEEVFLPYIRAKDGRTLYQSIQENGFNLKQLEAK